MENKSDLEKYVDLMNVLDGVVDDIEIMDEDDLNDCKIKIEIKGVNRTFLPNEDLIDELMNFLTTMVAIEEEVENEISEEEFKDEIFNYLDSVIENENK